LRTDEPPEKRSLLTHLISELSFVRGNFLILIVSWVIMDFAREIPGTYYPLYVRALGGTAATVGLIGSASMLTLALVQFPGGYLADKYGRRWLITTLTFGVALSYIFYIIAPDWRFILLGAVVHSLCAIYQPALNAMTMDSLPPERRGMGFSLINLIASVSATPAPLIAGFLYARFGLVKGLRMGYTYVLASYLAAALLRLRLRETIGEPRRIRGRELLASLPRAVSEGLRVWGEVPSSASILLASNLIGMFSASMIEPLITIYAVEDLGITPIQWSYILIVLFVSMILFALPSGKLIDKAGRGRSLLLAYLLWVSATVLFIEGDFLRVLVAMPLVGLMHILLMSASSALLTDLVPKSHRGRVSGSSGFFRLLSMSAGQLLGGLLYERVSHRLPLLLQLLMILPSSFLVLLLRDPERREE
jgi:MFS family permease